MWCLNLSFHFLQTKFNLAVFKGVSDKSTFPATQGWNSEEQAGGHVLHFLGAGKCNLADIRAS